MFPNVIYLNRFGSWPLGCVVAVPARKALRAAASARAFSTAARPARKKTGKSTRSSACSRNKDCFNQQ